MKKIFTLMFCLCALGASATIWRLNNNLAVEADFRTFAEAQEAASAGDTIFVEGNGMANHYGQITITKKLVLIGPGYFLDENDSTYVNGNFARFMSITVQSTAPGTEIYGIYLFSGDYNIRYLTIRASNVIAARNFFNPHDYEAIRIDSVVQNVTIAQNFAYRIDIAAAASNFIISNNYIHDRINLNPSSNGIISNNVISTGIFNAYNSQIKNNILFAMSGGDVFTYPNTGNFISYNILSGALGTGSYGPGNVANVSMADVFLGYPSQGNYSRDQRWQLKPDGPAAGAGEEEIDCGMFGGALPYILSGLPAVPRVYEAVVPTAGSTSAGLPVIIKIKSQN
ncbi:MAG: right-handed parallel beta-helix repeat-containing protein [Bacteroides sp.]|nr:right-handed parallel beta-helix repeat-containing protein [Bacteroides sp.]